MKPKQEEKKNFLGWARASNGLTALKVFLDETWNLRGILKVARVDRRLAAFANRRGASGGGSGGKVLRRVVVGEIMGGRRGGKRRLRGVTVREGMRGVSQSRGLSFLWGYGPIKFTTHTVIINNMMVVRGGIISVRRMAIERPTTNVFNIVQ